MSSGVVKTEGEGPLDTVAIGFALVQKTEDFDDDVGATLLSMLTSVHARMGDDEDDDDDDDDDSEMMFIDGDDFLDLEVAGVTKSCRNSQHSVWFPDLPTVRPLVDFAKNKNTKDGFRWSCKDCIRYRDKKKTQALNKKRGRPDQLQHCGACGKPGHRKDSCTSKTKIAAGMKRCSNGQHSEWFPDIAPTQPISCFYKGVSRCKSCDKERKRIYREKKNQGKKRAKI